MPVGNRKLFRQGLNPGGSALVPIISETAKRSMKMPLWNMLKFGAVPWMYDQLTDIMGPTDDLKTVEPQKDETATLDLNEQITVETNNLGGGSPENPPGAAGNVNIDGINANENIIDSVGMKQANDEKDAAINNDAIGDNSVLANAALEMDAGNIFPQNESLTEIKGYADALRNLLGGDVGQKQANTALLLQLGMALMTGKTLQGGPSGFLDVAGQAGLQVAPMMMQMGMARSEQDRSLGLAAFQVWKEENDKSKKRSGSFYNVYQVGYEDDGKGAPAMLPNGMPRYSSNTFRDVVQQNSPEMTDYMGMNKDPKLNEFYPYPKFIPISQTASEAGGMGFGTAGASGLSSVTKAGAQDQLKFAKYIYTNIDEVYKYLNIAMEKQHLIGAKGELGQFLTAPAYYFDELVKGSGQDQQKMMSDFKGTGLETVKNLTSTYMEGGENYDPSTGIGIVNDAPNSMMSKIYGKTYTGPDLEVFVDYNNSKGQNLGVSASNPNGEPSIYMVKSELERMYSDPDIPAMKVFERTLGLLLARSRQPTGRMLADVLRTAFSDASITGFTGSEARPNMVINKLWALANKLEGDMISGFLSAGVVPSDWATSKFEGGVKEAQSRGYKVDDELFNFPAKQAAIDKFYELYFTPDVDGIWREKYTSFPLNTNPANWAGNRGNTISFSNKQDSISLDEQFQKEIGKF
tara:strand:- start:1472 stop:3544 length:2073 start_codon:yes stop_codon:yes gene_type:complete